MDPSIHRQARRLWRSCAVLLVIAVMLAGSLATVGAQQLLDVLPSVTRVTPSTIVAGTPGAEVCLTGVNLGTAVDARVLVNSQERAVTSVSATQVCTQLTTADLANPGTLSLQARTVVGDSAPATLTINAPLPTTGAPTVGFPTPGTIVAGTPGAQVCLPGANFTADAQVLVNGQPRVVTSVSPNEICFTLTPGDLAVPGILQTSVLGADGWRHLDPRPRDHRRGGDRDRHHAADRPRNLPGDPPGRCRAGRPPGLQQ